MARASGSLQKRQYAGLQRLEVGTVTLVVDYRPLAFLLRLMRRSRPCQSHPALFFHDATTVCSASVPGHCASSYVRSWQDQTLSNLSNFHAVLNYAIQGMVHYRMLEKAKSNSVQPVSAIFSCCSKLCRTGHCASS